MNKDIKTFKYYLNTYLKSKGVLRLLLGNIITEQFKPKRCKSGIIGDTETK